MLVLNKQHEIINDDWQFVAEEASASEIVENNIIAFSALEKSQVAQLDFGKNALWIKHPDEIDGILPYLNQLKILAIYFPVFKNGVGFSLAKRLRDEFNYQGELRAVGDLLPDQFAMLLECGFDSVAMSSKHDNIAIWQHAVNSVIGRYQQDNKADFQSLLTKRHRR